MERKIQLPITRETARTIKSGESCLLSGVIYTARDAAHKRLCELLKDGKPLPFDVRDATIYYVGPTPAKPGQVIGSVGQSAVCEEELGWHLHFELTRNGEPADLAELMPKETE